MVYIFVCLTVQFIGRCTTLCCLWVLTNWLIAYSLKTLKATEVLTLFATTTSFLYLLSWVVLHQQFVGLRVSGHYYTFTIYIMAIFVFLSFKRYIFETDFGCDLEQYGYCPFCLHGWSNVQI